VIPRAFITAWQANVPWPELYQVEQDLILSRLMIEIAQNELLKKEFVMRGGTCLHKLHLTEPRRYSEDLDYVRRTHSGIGPYLDELHTIAADVGLAVTNVDFSEQMVHMFLDADATVEPGRIRIKVETNIVETDYFKDPTTIDLAVDSRWWSGTAPIPTFVLDEMMSTKTRALYQRSKGRDLFDLWLVLTTEYADDAEIIAGLRHYMGDGVFNYSEFRQNLSEKLGDAGFRSDMETLVTALPGDYDVDTAANVVVERLGSRLDGAPPLDEIRDGRWRNGV
jgi:predicted nucleotidyltransferase component of viral defense system